ncbi:murein biosynthesis integral membrane protein MurJ [candidate division CSSED10-310 bacterium]|uniref:Lipid II flippase n=1 Tax=candidate division CSSED10-310 bacterium TaxID=2855610 RepID=A0ABV6YU41_UNCC1
MNTRGILKAASIITILSVSSKLLGIYRLHLMAKFYGRSIEADAFALAFTILEFIRHFIAGGTIVAAIIPVYRALVVSKNEKKLAFTASNLLNIFSLVLIGAVGCWYIFGAALFRNLMFFFGEYFEEITQSKATIELTISLGNIMFPAIVFFGLVSVATAILNSFQHFVSPAATPVVLNGAIIFCLLGLHPTINIYSMALGVLLGTVLQVFILYPPLRKRLSGYQFSLVVHDPQMKEIWLLLKPLLWGVISYRFVFLINKLFAMTRGAGDISALFYSEFLVLSMVDILGIALATALFPSLSGYYSEHREAEFTRTTLTFLKITILLALPAMGILMVLGEPIIALIFQSDQFGSTDTWFTFSVLFFLAPTVLFQCLNYVMRNVYFASRDMITPVVTAISTLALNLVLMVILIGPLGTRGIALATTVAYGVQSACLMLLFKRARPDLPVRPLRLFLIKLGLTTSVALGSSALLFHFCSALVIDALLSVRIGVLALSLLSFAISFTCCGFLLKMTELNSVFSYMKEKFWKATPENEVA